MSITGSKREANPGVIRSIHVFVDSTNSIGRHRAYRLDETVSSCFRDDPKKRMTTDEVASHPPWVPALGLIGRTSTRSGMAPVVGYNPVHGHHSLVVYGLVFSVMRSPFHTVYQAAVIIHHGRAAYGWPGCGAYDRADNTNISGMGLLKMQTLGRYGQLEVSGYFCHPLQQ